MRARASCGPSSQRAVDHRRARSRSNAAVVALGVLVGLACCAAHAVGALVAAPRGRTSASCRKITRSPARRVAVAAHHEPQAAAAAVDRGARALPGGDDPRGRVMSSRRRARWASCRPTGARPLGGDQRVSRALRPRTAPTRGVYEIGPARLRSGDPFGLFTRRARRGAAHAHRRLSAHGRAGRPGAAGAAAVRRATARPARLRGPVARRGGARLPAGRQPAAHRLERDGAAGQAAVARVRAVVVAAPADLPEHADDDPGVGGLRPGAARAVDHGRGIDRARRVRPALQRRPAGQQHRSRTPTARSASRRGAAPSSSSACSRRWRS